MRSTSTPNLSTLLSRLLYHQKIKQQAGHRTFLTHPLLPHNQITWNGWACGRWGRGTSAGGSPPKEVLLIERKSQPLRSVSSSQQGEVEGEKHGVWRNLLSEEPSYHKPRITNYLLLLLLTQQPLSGRRRTLLCSSRYSSCWSLHCTSSRTTSSSSRASSGLSLTRPYPLLFVPGTPASRCCRSLHSI